MNEDKLKAKIEALESKIEQQQEELNKLNKKAKRSSFWLTYLLLGKEK